MEWNYFIVDIGAEIMSFAQMMSGAAEIMELKRFIIPVPLFFTKNFLLLAYSIYSCAS